MITKMKKLCNTLRHFVERQHKRFFLSMPLFMNGHCLIMLLIFLRIRISTQSTRMLFLGVIQVVKFQNRYYLMLLIHRYIIRQILNILPMIDLC